MNLNDALFAVTKSVHEELGEVFPIDPADAHAVEDYLNQGGQVSDALFFTVERLDIESFLQAAVDDQWNVVKDHLWARLQAETLSARSAPVWYTPDAQLGNLAMYLSR